MELDNRRQLLGAALGFLSLEPREPELRLLHNCFDTWRGIGDIVAGMARQEYDVELRRYNGRGWRAMFFLSGFEHSRTPDAGSAWARSLWERCSRQPRMHYAGARHRSLQVRLDHSGRVAKVKLGGPTDVALTWLGEAYDRVTVGQQASSTSEGVRRSGVPGGGRPFP